MFAVLKIGESVFASMAAESVDRFCTTVVADWLAIYDKLAGTPSRQSFENAYEFALIQVERAQKSGVDIANNLLPHLIHCQLLSIERGCQPEIAFAAGETFLAAMPAGRAAQILLHVELGL